MRRKPERLFRNLRFVKRSKNGKGERLMQLRKCVSCGKELKKKNEIGINRKLLGDHTTAYYCLDCMAEYLEVTVQDIQDKIEEFRAQGCKLFE